jgi:release factor glutamine methyltransferase
MLSTPSTSHVSFENIYEPAEDSFLMLDTLSSDVQIPFLTSRFNAPPLVLEVGSGSGVILGFAAMHAQAIFGRSILTAATDLNVRACEATAQTVASNASTSSFLGSVNTDLTAGIRPGSVDVLLFNPPYVPTDEAPYDPSALATTQPKFDQDSMLLHLSYAGGPDGMATTQRLLDSLDGVLSPVGVAYVLLCKGNGPEAVAAKIREAAPRWDVSIAGDSGKKAGWERLFVLRIARPRVPGSASD